jgi:hypothetical protein
MCPLLLIQLAACTLLVLSKRLPRKLKVVLAEFNAKHSVFMDSCIDVSVIPSPSVSVIVLLPFSARHIPSFAFLFLQLLVVIWNEGRDASRTPLQITGFAWRGGLPVAFNVRLGT